MPQRFIVATVALAGSLMAMLLNPSFSTATAFVASCALFGALHAIEQRKKDELDEVLVKIEKLSARVDGISLGGRIGR